MTTFQRPVGLREWLNRLETRISRLEAGGVRPVQEDTEESGVTRRPLETEPVPHDSVTLEQFLRRHPWPR